MGSTSDRIVVESKRGIRSFRRAVLGGLGVVLPPLLTLVILVWIWNTVKYYVLEPVTAGAGSVLTWSLSDVRTDLPGAVVVDAEAEVFLLEGQYFKRVDGGQYVPLEVYDLVLRTDGERAMPAGGAAIYRRYIDLRYLRPHIVVPLFLIVFVLIMYLLGSLFAAGLGRVWSVFERAISRLPLVRGVYGSVKQVTDFMLTEQELEFTRVVAIEYPCKGNWTLAFVTGDGLPELYAAVGEPMLSLLIPTAPMPVTGYTIVMARSEVVDIDMTIDQAIQYIVSCGVVVPSHQIRGGMSPAIP